VTGEYNAQTFFSSNKEHPMRIGEVAPASETAVGPREGLVILVALAAILTWGFTGWEYPEIEAIGSGVAQVAADQGRGAELFQANGCYACHSLEGETIIGPTLLGIYGTTVELEDGSSVLIDDAYLIESILQPEAKRVAGYGEAAMPSYDGLVSADDAEALADYIKNIR
jgi:mono/diheme cytochrome c family protein